MSRHRAALRLAAACGLLLAGSAASRADWLVTQEGARLEIKGPWKVAGKVVTFTLPNGTLGSLRLSEVDLTRSAEATAAALVAADVAKSAPASAAAPGAKPTAVMVITDADVSHAADAPASAPAAAAAAADAAVDKAPDTSTGAAVVVTAWDKSFSQVDNGVAITGTVRNNGKTVAAALGVDVRLYDEQGQLLGSAPATLSTEALEPGAAARFRVAFPGVTTFMAAKFDVASTAISKEAPTEQEEPPPSR